MVNYIQDIFLRGNLLQVMMAVTLAGFAASLSSCTLARLPFLLGVASSKTSSHHRGFLLSIAFSCGLMLSFTVMGMLLGTAAHLISGLMAISRYVYMFLGISMLISGMFFAGLVPWHGVSLETKKIIANETVPSAFIFGMLFAFIEIPACPSCAAGIVFIAGLSTVQHSVLFAAMVFFSFSLGQSLPVLVIGYSSKLLRRLTGKAAALETATGFIMGNFLITAGICMLVLA